MIDEKDSNPTDDEGSPTVAPPKKSKTERLLEEELWYARKISGACAFEKRCKNSWEMAKERAKECKELLDGASASLRNLIEDRDKLEDRPILTECDVLGDDDPGDPDDDDEDNQADADEVDAQPDDQADQPAGDWKTVPLRGVLPAGGLGDPDVPDILDAVNAAIAATSGGFSTPVDPTMEDLHHLFAAGGTIDALELDNEAKVAFFDAINAWAQGYAWHTDVTYPEAFPLSLRTTKYHVLEKARHRARARASKARKRTNMTAGKEADGE